MQILPYRSTKFSKSYDHHGKTKNKCVKKSKVLRADGRLVNMSGVFCTNNAQAPSLFSNVALLPETVSTNDRLLVSVTLEKREGACALIVQKTPDM